MATVTPLKSRDAEAPAPVVAPAAPEIVARADPPAPADVAAPPAGVGDAPPKSRRKRWLIGGGVGLLLAGGAAFGANYWLVGQYRVTTDNAYVRAGITPIASKLEGYVLAVPVADNQAVRAGDLLARIDPSDYRARVAQADADVAAARAALAQARAGSSGATAQVAAQGSVVASAVANLDAAQASAVKADADARRFRGLAAQGWVTRAQLDQANASARAAAAQVTAARAAIAQQRSQVQVAGSGSTRAAADVAAARARVQAAQAALGAARIDLGRTELRAPVDGVIGNRNVRPGQMVRTGTVLMAVVPVQAAFVVANFKETQLARMRPGQPVAIHIDAYPSIEIRGRVDSLAPASGAQFALIPTDSATGNFTRIVQRVPVKIAVDPGQMAAGLLRPGLSVEATVITKE